MKNSIKVIFLTALMIVGSCKKNETTQQDREKITVSLGQPVKQTQAYIVASGKVEAVQKATISTRIMGYVTNIPVKVGDYVNKGQTLIDISSDDIQSQIAQAHAAIQEANVALLNAETDYKRYKALLSTGSATQKEFDNIKMTFDMSKARLEAATQAKNQSTVQLSYTKIKAPFSGIITGNFTNEGAISHPGQPLLSIENTGNYQTTAMIPETEISHIIKGSSVEVQIKSLKQKTYGTVTEISTSALHSGGQYLVKITMDKTNFPVYSGMFTTVKIPTSSEQRSDGNILIPNSAIIRKGGLTGIYTISSQNTAVLRWLRLGQDTGEFTEVISGLTAEESFIHSSDALLYNGAPVQILD